MVELPKYSYSRSLRSHWTALLASVLVSSLVEFAHALFVRQVFDAIYFAAVLALALLPTGAVALVTARFAGPPATLAIFAFATFAVTRAALPASAAAAAITLLAPRLCRRSGGIPVYLGAASGLAIGTAQVALPALLPSSAWLRCGVYGAVLTVACGAAGLTATRRARFALGLAFALGGLGVAALPGKPVWIDMELPERPAARAPRSPSALVIVMDTVRADHLSLYGYARETTPNLEALVRETPRAVRYDQVRSTSPWTVPSHASLFTGELPSTHAAITSAFPTDRLDSWGEMQGTTLAEHIRDADYLTFGIAANPWLTIAPGLSRGFDVFYSPPRNARSTLLGELVRLRFLPLWLLERSVDYPPAQLINDSVIRAFEHCGDHPCFVFANYMEGHSPYVPSAGFSGRFDSRRAPREFGPATTDIGASELSVMEARYDEAIAGLDARLGELVAWLRKTKRLDDMWLVITSDHGEAFMEHGAGEHGTAIYDEEVRVPLVVVPPRGISLPRVDGAVSLLDVTATLSAALGRSGPIGRGLDLRRADIAAQLAARVEFFGDASKASSRGALAGLPARAVVRGRWKLLEIGGELSLYDVLADPGERHDVAHLNPERTSELRAQLPPLRLGADSSPARADPGLTQEDKAALRALGYVQ